MKRKKIAPFNYVWIVLIAIGGVFLFYYLQHLQIGITNPFLQEKLPIVEKEIPFTGLEIEGLNHVYQNGRWEYLDPNDGLVAGFWDEEGKFKLTSKILRGEWRGLFVSALQEQQILRDNFKEVKEWNKENWEKGEIKIPIPFDITKGGVIEKRTFVIISLVELPLTTTALMIKDLPLYLETTVFAPFPTKDIEMAEGGGTQEYSIIRGDIRMGIVFPSIYENFLDSYFLPLFQKEIGVPADIKIGTPIVKLDGGKAFPPGAFKLFNLFLKGRYQLLFSVDDISGPQAYSDPVDFSFENFLQDKEGRFIYLGPILMEMEIVE